MRAKAGKASVVTSLFMTEGEVEKPTLITMGDTPKPPHPNGKNWRFFVGIYDHPRNVVIGRKLVGNLLKQGFVIDERAVEALIKRRP